MSGRTSAEHPERVRFPRCWELREYPAVVRAELDAKVRRAHRDLRGAAGPGRAGEERDRCGSENGGRLDAPAGSGRDFAAAFPDITYLRTGEGWVYLCAVRDACSRRVIGWAMDSAQTSGLVERALRMAYILRGGGPDGVVFHADRGTQYTSTQLNEVCTGLGIKQSVGRTGVCWDNAMQESFWSTLKTEFYDRRRWAKRQDAIRATGRWIEEFYNRARLHSALGYNTPVEHEQILTSNKPQPAQAA